MRLWSLHPRYLDTIGLVALWRETLLAQKVLQNRTRGYKNHPQLNRFRREKDPINYIGLYLQGVFTEAKCREFKFNETKIVPTKPADPISVTTGQMEFEWIHLLEKLKIRSPDLYRELNGALSPEPHSMFKVVQGYKEDWERGTFHDI